MNKYWKILLPNFQVCRFNFLLVRATMESPTKNNIGRRRDTNIFEDLPNRKKIPITLKVCQCYPVLVQPSLGKDRQNKRNKDKKRNYNMWRHEECEEIFPIYLNACPYKLYNFHGIAPVKSSWRYMKTSRALRLAFTCTGMALLPSSALNKTASSLRYKR